MSCSIIGINQLKFFTKLDSFRGTKENVDSDKTQQPESEKNLDVEHVGSFAQSTLELVVPLPTGVSETAVSF
jgi:hypothetical protein